MTLEDTIKELCLKVAAKSPCSKRKVGAIVIQDGLVIGSGFNYNADDNTDGNNCEENGVTVSTVIHAEVDAIQCAQKYMGSTDLKGCTLYVTHTPCDNCSAYIKRVNISKVIIVDNFLKFDAGKLMYNLIPPEASKALAEVLTYGAKKYKPGNWKECKDTDRYIAALIRHLEAHRMGELRDEESGMLHMAHVLTNAAFIIYFLTNSENENGKD